MIVEEGAHRVSLSADEQRAAYHGVSVQLVTISATPKSGPVRRCLVELHHRMSGHPQRALLGATLVPRNRKSLAISIPMSGKLTLGAKTTCPSRLDRRLVPGLPDEFTEAVLEGISLPDLPAGELIVDRAAYDEVASSPFAFRHVAELVAVLLARWGSDQVGEEVRRQMRSWA
jgi:hypothetical protein